MLRDELLNKKDSFKKMAPMEIQKKMEAALDDLKKTKKLDDIIKRGEKIPSFKIEGEDTLTNENLLGKKVVFNFFRGSW